MCAQLHLRGSLWGRLASLAVWSTAGVRRRATGFSHSGEGCILISSFKCLIFFPTRECKGNFRLLFYFPVWIPPAWMVLHLTPSLILPFVRLSATQLQDLIHWVLRTCPENLRHNTMNRKSNGLRINPSTAGLEEPFASVLANPSKVSAPLLFHSVSTSPHWFKHITLVSWAAGRIQVELRKHLEIHDTYRKL